MADDGNGNGGPDGGDGEHKPVDISIERARKRRQQRREAKYTEEEKARPRQEWDMALRRDRVMKLRVQGYRTGDQIAEQLKIRFDHDVTPETCRNDLLVIDAQLTASAEANREVEKGRQLEQVRGMIVAIFPRALAGDLFTIDRMVSLLKLEASILGTEAPKEIRFNPIEVAKKVAAEEGLDEAEVLAIAEDILSRAREAGLT